MKKFNWLLLAVLLTIVAIVPNTAAAFADQPVAFVVFDNSGNVTQQVYKMWREPVRWAYHFPDFKLVDTDRTKKVTAENIFTKKQYLNFFTCMVTATPGWITSMICSNQQQVILL